MLKGISSLKMTTAIVRTGVGK